MYRLSGIDNPTLALASLIRPEEDRLLAMRATSYDSFVLMDGKRTIVPRPPLMPSGKARHSLFDILASGVKQPGDSLKIVRLSESSIGVYFENPSFSEVDVMEEYNAYVASIDCPSKYARAWRDFVSLMLQSVEAIAGGMEAVLSRKDGVDLDSRIYDLSELALISSLSPHATSLKKMFDITSAFYANPLMVGRWENAFIRGQKHHMGNALFLMVLMNQFLDSGMLTYRDAHDMVQGAAGVFNPLVHIREALNREDVGKWLNIQVVEGADADIRPLRRLALRRTVDEIFYRAGAEAEGVAQRIDVRWHEVEGVLSLGTDGEAFRSLRKGGPARKRLSEIYGDSGIQFIKERTDRDEDRISLIRISVEQRGDSGSAGGGEAAGSESNSEGSVGDSAAAIAMQAGADLYATSISAATAAAVSIPSR